eukprot:1290519-Rhodomonas_salina.3
MAVAGHVPAAPRSRDQRERRLPLSSYARATRCPGAYLWCYGIVLGCSELMQSRDSTGAALGVGWYGASY